MALGGALAIHLGLAFVLGWQSPAAGSSASGDVGLEVSLGLISGIPGTREPVGGQVDPLKSLEPGDAATVEPRQREASELPVETIEPARSEAIPAKNSAPVERALSALDPVADVALVEAAHERETREQDVDERRVQEEPAVETLDVDRPRWEIESSEVVAEAVTSATPVDARTVESPGARQSEAAPTVSPSPSPVPDQSTTAANTPGKDIESGDGGLGGDSREGERAAGRQGVKADYALTLRSWLERHKRYPGRARRHRLEGTAFLYFVMDRKGNVVDYQLRKSSGHRLLDEEVEKMIRRAQPLPRFPESLGENHLAFVVPIEFSLR